MLSTHLFGSLVARMAPARRALLALLLTLGVVGLAVVQPGASAPVRAADPVVACAAGADGALRLVASAADCTPGEAALTLTDASAPVVVCAIEASGPLHAAASAASCEAVGAQTIRTLPHPTQDTTLCAVTATGQLHLPGAPAAVATCDPATETTVVVPATPAPEPTATSAPPTSTTVPTTQAAPTEAAPTEAAPTEIVPTEIVPTEIGPTGIGPTATAPVGVQADAPAPNRVPAAQPRSATVLEDGTVRLTLTGTDADGDRLTFSISRQPAKGALSAFGTTSCARSSSTGVMTCRAAIRYTPNDDAVGSDYFRFTVRDGKGGSSTATARLTITPVNDAPSFTPRGDVTAYEDVPYSRVWAVDRRAGPSDEQGQALTFTVRSNTNPGLFSTQPSISSVGRLTFVPAPAADGTATLSVELSDSGGTASGGDDAADPVTLTITVQPVNDEPSFTVSGPTTFTFAEDSAAVSRDGWATGMSPGADPSEGGQTTRFVVSLGSPADLAKFTDRPEVSPAGVLSFAPAPDANGAVTLRVRLRDSGPTTGPYDDHQSPAVTVTLTLSPVNDAPVDNPDGRATTAEDTPVTLQLDGIVTDVETAANWSALAITTPPIHGALSGLNLADGTVVFTPDADYAGTDGFTYTLTDTGDPAGCTPAGPLCDTTPKTGTGTVTLTVTPVNDAPSFALAGAADQTVAEDAGPQSVPGLATGMSTGPGNESGQALAFAVATTNDALFGAGPAIDAATGALTYTPALGAHGSATVTVTLADDGGTADGGVDTSAAQTFSITVTPVNDAPSFTGGGDVTVDEDSGAADAPWATAISPGPNETQALTFTVTADDNSLFSVLPALSATGELSFTPAPDANGTTTVTVTLTDDGGTADGGDDTSPTASLTITVTPVNDAPSYTLGGGADQTVLEDAGPHTVGGFATGLSTGPADESGQALAFAVTTDSDALFSAAPVVNATTGALTYTVAQDANGSAEVTVVLSDDGGTADGGDDTSPAQTFTIAVTPVNDAPGFDLPTSPHQAVVVDSPRQTVPDFLTNPSPGPSNERGQELSLLVTNDLDSLFTTQPAVDLATGDLTYTPAPAQIGTATVTVTLSDDGGTADSGDDSTTRTFTITVRPPNAAPTADDTSASGAEDGGAITVTLTGHDADDDALTFEVGTATDGLVTVPSAVDCTSTPSTCTATVTYTPAADFTGSDRFTYTVNDGTETSGAATASITVTSVNDAPGATAGSAATNEDTAVTLTLSGSDVDGDSLTFTVASAPTKGSLGPITRLTPTTASVSYTPNANASGTDSFTYTVSDGTVSSAPATVGLTVAPVNDAPSFTKGADQTVLEDAGAQSVSNWATAISKGPADESGQTLSSATSNDHNALFSVQPGVSPSGTLVYTPAPDAFGTATVTVTLADDGGTADGGRDTSAPQTFTITITSVNDTPAIADVETDPLTYTEGDPAVLITGALTLSDADDTMLEGATLTVGSGFQAGDVLGFVPQSGIIGGYDGATGVLALTGSATLADYRAALRSATFAHTGDAPSASRTLTVTVSDGDALSAPAGRTVAITAVNDAPVVGVPGSQTVDEDTALVFSAATGRLISVADVDAGSGRLTLTLAAANGTATLASTSGLTGVSGNGTGTVTASGTLTTLNAALASVTYQGASNSNDSRGTASLTVAVGDNGSTGTGGALSDSELIAITVNPVNDLPSAQNRPYGADSVETNMQRSIDAASGLLTGATDPDSGDAGFTLDLDVGTVNGVAPVSGTITTTIASVGTVVVDAETGAFTFDPAPGVTGPVSFPFTVCDNGTPTPSACSPAVSASFAISGPVTWFVDPAASVNGTGTLASPFKTLAAADAVDAANHRIFLYSGTTTTGIALQSGAWLIGQGATGAASFDALMGITVPSGTLARPAVATGTATVQNTLTLNTNAVVKGVALATTTTTGLTDPAGAITGVSVSQVAVTTTTGTGVSLSDIAGTLSFSGLTTTGGTGASLTGSNGSATFGFTGVSVSSGANPAFTATGGGTVNVTGSTNTVTTTTGTALALNGVAGALAFSTVATNGAGTGIELVNVGAGVTIGGGSIQNTTVAGVTIGTATASSGGNGAFSFGGTVSNTSGRTIQVQNRTGGSVTFSGNLTGGGTGILVQNNASGAPTVTFSGTTKTLNTGANAAVTLSGNTGATISFTGGGLDIDTTSGAGLSATGGGTATVSGVNNTITSGSGTALNVTNTTIGASGLTFQAVSSNGAANGIVLNTTGSLGGLTVTGNGGTCTPAVTSGCSGGQIQNTTGADNATATPGGTGIVLNNTRNVSLTHMWIHDHSNYGIRGTSVVGFVLNSSVINGTNGTNDATPYNDSSVSFDELTGTVTVSSTSISGGYANNIEVNDTSGVLNGTFTAVTIGANSVNGGNDGLQVEGVGSATVNVSVLNSTFTSSRGDLFQYIGDGTGGGALVFTGNTLSNNHPGIATGGGGVTVTGGGNGPTTMNISNNTSRDSLTAAFTIAKSPPLANGPCPAVPGTLVATVDNNTIGLAGVANSGSLEGSGFAITQAGCGTMTMAITNNRIYQYNNFGISLQAGAGIAYSGAVNFTVTGNTIANPGNNPNVTLFQGVALNSGVTPGDAYQVCAHISGNTASNLDPGGAHDLRVRARQSTTVRLPGYAGGNTDTTAVANFLLGQNTATTASAVVAAGSGGFVGGSACPQPPAPASASAAPLPASQPLSNPIAQTAGMELHLRTAIPVIPRFAARTEQHLRLRAA